MEIDIDALKGVLGGVRVLKDARAAEEGLEPLGTLHRVRLCRDRQAWVSALLIPDILDRLSKVPHSD